MKKVFRGWIGKSERIDDLFWKEGIDSTLEMADEAIYFTKGNNKNWVLEDWPPRRITITVEVEE